MSDPGKRLATDAAEALLAPTPYDPHMRRPLTTVTGAGLMLLGSAVGLLALAGVVERWHIPLLTLGAEFDDALGPAGGAVRAGVIVLLIGIFAFNAVMALLVFVGWNWPRVLVMAAAVLNTSSAFGVWLSRGAAFGSERELYPLALDILILLALSSRSAAAYARRRERQD